MVYNSEENDREGVVKVGRLKTVIPAGQTKEVKCSVRTGPLPTKQEVLFKPAEVVVVVEVVSVDHVKPDQQEKVSQMLKEDCAAFSKGENDIGCIPSLQLKIRLSDTTPVKRNYTSVPKPLHKEVKQYLEDLLKRGWIQKFRSP